MPKPANGVTSEMMEDRRYVKSRYLEGKEQRNEIPKELECYRRCEDGYLKRLSCHVDARDVL